MLCVSLSTVWRWLEEGRIKYIQPSRKIIIPASELERILSEFATPKSQRTPCPLRAPKQSKLQGFPPNAHKQEVMQALRQGVTDDNLMHRFPISQRTLYRYRQELARQKGGLSNGQS
jgi:hypothetical protein